MTNVLEQLKKVTLVVADTGELSAIKTFQPVDATTNPSLILKAAQSEEYQALIDETLSTLKADYQGEALVDACSDYLTVNIGTEISKLIPGRISTEVDARLSFDTQATIDKAHKLIKLYEANGVSSDRVLIKVAATWEGIQAAKQLEEEGIQCNLTLIFSMAQAVACAESKVFLISPFVGRILDWYKAKQGVDHIPAEQDPGVLSVREIYHYYKSHGYQTIVMGASFRTKEEIMALSGCDRLTISPALLQELQETEAELAIALPSIAATETAGDALTESQFRWQLNQDPMATEKLAEGIRKFAEDQVTLEDLIRSRI